MTFPFLANIIALLFSFFVVGAVLGAAFSQSFRKKILHAFHPRHRRERRLVLRRSPHNPILLPGKSHWTAEAVMNPTALVLGGRTHLIYRAVGMDGVSRLGYASSKDGIFFDERYSHPIFAGRSPYSSNSRTPLSSRRYSPVMYPSGGSWGGVEDPRMTLIDGRVYVTFNMFENASWTLRVAVISMSQEDFLAGRFWKWKDPIILSHGKRDKNWVLFPEKIHGQFAVLHSIIDEDPNRVRIEYTDDLTTLSKRKFVSPDPLQVPDNQIAWHYRMRSAGPPPLKTDRGWLVFYHAMDPKEPNRYKLGAMLLDLDDPTKVLYRAATPILEPDAHYENAGKPGIIYASGAVVRDGKLFVYYGGADKVVCVATASLKEFIDHLIKDGHPTLESMPVEVA
jgi:predicted GH43/DUF377 family glycosyl hydrolase